MPTNAQIRLPIGRLIEAARRQRSIKVVEEAVRCELLPQKWEGVYTPEMLKRFLDWTAETCAFPLCEEPQASVRMDNKWHLCSVHNHRLKVCINLNRWLKKTGRKDSTSPENRRAIARRHYYKRRLQREEQQNNGSSTRENI